MYKTQNGWTKKSIIDHIIANFNGKSVVGKSSYNADKCMYRGENDAKCAAGLFIPDDVYTPEMDARNLSAPAVIKDYKLDKYMPLDPEGMYQFQGVHDNSRPEKTLEMMVDFIEHQVED